MTDFSLINANVDWNLGAKLEILDEHSQFYAVNFNRIINNKIHSVIEKCDFSPFTWYKTNYTFRIKWQIKIWGWRNKPILVYQNTYDETNQNICLHFVSDVYESHCLWFNMAKLLSLQNHFNLHIISKYANRLSEKFSDSTVKFHDNTYDYESIIKTNNIYATYVIDRKEIVTKSANHWETETVYLNHSKSAKTWDHPIDWFDLNDEQLFKNLMDI